MAANKHRGEVPIKLGGKDRVMRASFQAMCQIESVTGRGIAELVDRFITTRFGLAETVAIITAGLKEAGEPATPEKVGQMVMEAGLRNVAKPALEFLMLSLGGAARGESEAVDGD